MSINNNTVGTTEITPVETEVTRSEKQESRDFSRGRFNNMSTRPGNRPVVLYYQEETHGNNYSQDQNPASS